MSKGKGNIVAEAVQFTEPDFWKHRVAIFDELFKQQLESYQKKKAPIKVTLPDGKVLDAEAWQTTPIDIAKQISNSLPDKVIVAKVNEQLWDLTRPLEGDSRVELLDWDDAEARNTYWHSSSHVLGYALERVFSAKLSVGPALEEGGFFYEGLTPRPVQEGDYKAIESAMTELVKQKAPYQRLVIKKEDALKLFNYTEFKSKILAAKVPEGGSCTVYRCGNLIDPCRGPHIPDTGRVKAFAITKNSSSYFEGKAENPVLQRVYGIAFPKEALLKEWQEIQREAALRDHRHIGRQQELFGFHEVSPGSAFWLPHGARIYNALVEFQRRQYRRRGFDEVVSPNIYNAKLWVVSGHWEHYKDAMFRTICEHEEFGLKPMNCPGHCMMFAMRPRSYKELPIRFADFGVLHRNELSGALTGLTRVRRFQQDDAHIFCRMDQIVEEIEGALNFLRDVYSVLGFNFFLKLSTKPENALGSAEVWSDAEERLASALNKFCNIPAKLPDPFAPGKFIEYDGAPATLKKLKNAIRKFEKDPEASWKGPTFSPWEVNPGDGAFYGPKIDIVVEDALRRRHQCATIQLDFNLPERFGLKYTLPTQDSSIASTDVPSEPAEGAKKKWSKEEPKHVDPAPAAAAATPAAEPASPKTPQAQHSLANCAHCGSPAIKNIEHLHIDKTLDPNQARPVMIHRAIFGSLERCIAILCEHYGGKWPLWLSPRQVVVIPVSNVYNDYAQRVRNHLHAENFYADADVSSATLDRKIRNGELAQYNFLLVVGQAELESESVNVRTRDNKQHGKKTLAEMTQWLSALTSSYSREF